MNAQIPPSGAAEPLPTVVEGGRELAYPYRGSPYPETEDAQNSLRNTFLHFVNLAYKYKWLILAMCVLALFGGFVQTVRSTKIYSAFTTIKIDRSTPRVINNPNMPADSAGYDPQFYQTQYELIRSHSMADRVATALNLAQTDFVARPQPSLLARLLGRGSSAATLPNDAASVRARHAQAIGKIMGGLTVQPVALSSIVRISFNGPEPDWAQRISIAVAENYARSIMDSRFKSSEYARTYLDERLAQVKQKLQESEKQLIEYAQKQGIIDVDNKQPQVAQQLEGVQSVYSEAVTNRVKLEQLWYQADRDGGMALPQVMSDGLIQQARARIAQLRATYQDKLNVMKPAFPEMVALQTQINQAERDIRNQINLIKASIKTQYEAAVAQESALGQKLAQLKAEALELRGRSVEYTILSREVDTARSLYDGLLQQVRQLAVVADVDVNNVSVVDRALLPTSPISPNLNRNLLIALILGLVAAAAIIALLEILDDTFKTPEDIEEKLNLPVLGVGPLFRSTEDKNVVSEVMAKRPTPLAEAYRSFRTALQFSTVDGVPRPLLVTSARPGEGKSTAAMCLAANFGQLGMRVLLIDADMRNPSLHRVLSIDNESGLSNLLAGSADASKLIKNCEIENVTVITTGPLPPNPAELLHGPRFTTLLKSACDAFDIVIIDGPPVMGLADAPLIGSAVAGTLLVVESGKTRRAVVRDAVKRLEFARARLVGVFLNKFDPHRAGFTYGHQHYGYAYNYHGEQLVYGQQNQPELEPATRAKAPDNNSVPRP